MKYQRMTNITIIGGGVSGVLLTIQLIRIKPGFPVSITLIEKEKAPWLGVAYSTNKPFHLLNVRAAKMSALPGEDDHFLSWLIENNYQLNADDFAPRSVFRIYIEDLFQKTLHDIKPNIDFKFINEEVVHIRQVDEHEAIVQLGNDQTVTANFIVLAPGNFTSTSSFAENPSLHANSAYYDNPWAPDVPGDLKKDSNILILGTGPTMIDTALTLYYQGHKGKITALSRHGLLPAVHAISEIYPDFSEEVKDVASLA